MTAEELMQLPDDDLRYELINGELDNYATTRSFLTAGLLCALVCQLVQFVLET